MLSFYIHFSALTAQYKSRLPSSKNYAQHPEMLLLTHSCITQVQAQIQAPAILLRHSDRLLHVIRVTDFTRWLVAAAIISTGVSAGCECTFSPAAYIKHKLLYHITDCFPQAKSVKPTEGSKSCALTQQFSRLQL